jgi:hypothetical protein
MKSVSNKLLFVASKKLNLNLHLPVVGIIAKEQFGRTKLLMRFF